MQDQASQSDVFGLLNTFSGGALFQFSIFAMGIMPYITASIIVQLLVHGRYSEDLRNGQKKASQVRKKLAQVTRYGTISSRFNSSFWYCQLGLTVLYNRIL